MRFWLRLLSGGLILLNAGCLPALSPPDPTDTPTPTVTFTPTPTIVWFPPTPTPTPRPTSVATPSPTPLPPPDVGDLLLRDDFSETSPWQLLTSERGNIAIANNRLTIATAAPRALLTSLRGAPELADYYLEVTARTNLCTGMDEYGVVFRAASQADFFRFTLSCNGQVRVERLAGGTASAPQPWTIAGAVPPGAPGQSRLGILADDRGLRFYVNDEFIFTVTDPAPAAGSIGLFARAAGDGAISVSFTDLVIYALSP
jgi:hypothetical protein